MAKTAVYDYSTTASSNSDFDGTDSSGATGKVKDGDNYARSIASHVKGFALDLGAVNTVGGTADAITVTLSSAPSALVDGMRITINASAANTGATTLNVTPAGGSAFGAKKVMKWSSGSEAELSANDIPAANALIELVYDSARNAAAGAWMLLGTSVAAATTSAAGIVELATLAETLAFTDSSRAVVPVNIPYPTGFVYGMMLSTNGSDATNDIDIAAGTARDASDSYNIIGTAKTKQTDTAWAVGTNAGSLDTGAVGNSRYAIWAIMRSDTRVVDYLTSTSFSSPTMPANYDYKVLIGEFTRTGGTNGKPVWYGPRAGPTIATDTLGIITPWVKYTATAAGFGTLASQDIWSRRVGDTLEVRGKFTAGTVQASEARLSLGFNGTDGNVTSDATKVASIQLAGLVARAENSVNSFVCHIESNVGYLTFGAQGSSQSGLNKANGNAIFSNGSVISINAQVPISGW